mgnify:CR=1 FL=1
MNALTAIFIVALVVLVMLMVVFLATRYKRCPSDKILVVYGKVGEGQSARCIHGGGAFILPLFQDYTYMSLTPLTISIPLTKALSQQNIRVNVPSTFTRRDTDLSGRTFFEQACPPGASVRTLVTRHPSNDFQRRFMAEGPDAYVDRQFPRRSPARYPRGLS